MTPTMKAPGTKRLKLEDYEVLSRCAFNLNLRRYSKAPSTNVEHCTQVCIASLSLLPGPTYRGVVPTVCASVRMHTLAASSSSLA